MAQIALARTAFATDASFPTRVPTITRPSGDGVHEIPGAFLDGGGGAIVVMPIGKGSENDAFDMHIILWAQIGRIWIPFHPFGPPMVCTLSTQTGVDGYVIPSTVRMVDTITNTDTAITSTSSGTMIVSPENQAQGWFGVPLMGAAIFEFIFRKNTNTPEMNAMWYYW